MLNSQRGGILGKLLKGTAILALVLVVAGLGFVRYIGAWNILFPSTQHDSVAPALPDDLGSPAVLVFSKTNSFRHKEGIEGGHKALAEIAAGMDLGLFATENGAVFNARDLARFDAVVFLNASGDMLDEAQEGAFQQWLEAGGGWLGIHAAGDGSHAGWQWYMDKLIGAKFIAHIMGPQFQVAEVQVERGEHPVMSGLPSTWDHLEEWYSWANSPRENGFTILATLNEDSYNPRAIFMGTDTDLRMGDHPVVWGNCVGLGRSVYAAMGHQAAAFDNPEYRQILQNSLRWLVGGADTGC